VNCLLLEGLEIYIGPPIKLPMYPVVLVMVKEFDKLGTLLIPMAALLILMTLL
jgi:hypothetical protein